MRHAMMSLTRRITLPGTVILGMVLALPPAALNAAPGTIAQTPLFISNPVKPNVMLSIDDSGSMDSEVLMPTNDGALWWNTSTQSFVGFETAGAVNFNTAGSANSTWKKFTYIYPNGTATGNRIYNDGSNAHYAIPPLPQYAFMRSAAYNKAYFDPTVTYTPWISYGSTTFSDIDETDAPSDPVRGTSKYNLTQNFAVTGSNFVFKMYLGMTISAGSYYQDWTDSTWKTASSDVPLDQERNVPIRYFPPTYYTITTTGTFSVDAGATTQNCSDTPNPANYTAFHADPEDFSGTVADALGPDGACLDETTISAGTSAMQNYANWFSYYRKRHLAMRGGVGKAFNGLTGLRTGLFTINNRINVTMLDFDTQSDSFYSTLYGMVGSGGTPNRQALDWAGQQYERTNSGAPITEACQKNFTIFFTDGFASLSGTLPNVSDEDNNKGSPYADSYNDTLADIAMNYYNNSGGNIRSGMATGQVPIDEGCPNAQLDCNANLHMATYTVGLGAKGTIFGVTHNVVADAYATPPTWPNTNAARDSTQIDDLYHAALNGRGEMYNASTPDALQSGFRQALDSIIAKTGAASAIALNTTELTAGTLLYQARFNSQNWTGELLGKDIDENTGAIAATENWDAAENIPAAGSRVIITYNPSATTGSGTGSGVAFTAANYSASFSATQNTDLETSLPAGLTVADRINYLRGDRSNENDADATPVITGKFRERGGTVLGDIVNSTPVVVGAPELSWPDGDGSNGFPSSPNAYSDFKTGAAASRNPIVYVGANDGMLHGFLAVETLAAGGGDEKLAFIPHSVYSSGATTGMHYLSDPNYSHRYYVDLSPTVADAYIKSRQINGDTNSTRAWKTVLIGGLRGGGAGLFALDVTDPSDFSEANAAKLVLWEFDSTDDADLGVTFSQPIVAPTKATDGSGDTRWAVIVGNGYNSSNCTARLFILFMDGGLDGTWTSGTDYIEIDTEAGSGGTCNGLSSPAVVDIDGDRKVDRVYAGDLLGNLWVFDLDDTSPGNWDVAYQQGNNPRPLFTATEASSTPPTGSNGEAQPITVKPLVVKNPDVADSSSPSNAPNALVLFGTGQYLANPNQDGDSDINDTSLVNTFYGVWDEGTKELDRSDLQSQTITELTVGSNTVRLITDNTVDWGSGEYGWYVDLPGSGSGNERVVVDPAIRGDIVFFNTAIPTTSGCDVGGDSWLMSLDVSNGGEPDSAVFDLNGDNVVDTDDLVTSGGTDRAPGGVKQGGLASSPTFAGNQRLVQYSTGEAESDTVAPTGVDNLGRFSWQELRQE